MPYKDTEKARESARLRYWKNPKKSNARNRARRKEKPEWYQEYHSRYKKENPDIIRAARCRYNSKLRGSRGTFTTQQWVELKRKFKNCCVCCRRSESTLNKLGLVLVIDHVIPIFLGGSTTIENLQPLCSGVGGCNRRKQVKTTDYRKTFPAS